MTPTHSIYSELLYARPTFIAGMGSVIDLGGTLAEFNLLPDPAEADRIALAADWYAIGQDMRAAIAEYRAECRATAEAESDGPRG